jgi:hypothetical protein
MIERMRQTIPFQHVRVLAACRRVNELLHGRHVTAYRKVGARRSKHDCMDLRRAGGSFDSYSQTAPESGAEPVPGLPQQELPYSSSCVEYVD